MSVMGALFNGDKIAFCKFIQLHIHIVPFLESLQNVGSRLWKVVSVGGGICVEIVVPSVEIPFPGKLLAERLVVFAETHQLDFFAEYVVGCVEKPFGILAARVICPFPERGL